MTSALGSIGKTRAGALLGSRDCASGCRPSSRCERSRRIESRGAKNNAHYRLKAGLTPIETIRSATIVPARAMKLDQEGKDDRGRQADRPAPHRGPVRRKSKRFRL